MISKRDSGIQQRKDKCVFLRVDILRTRIRYIAEYENTSGMEKWIKDFNEKERGKEKEKEEAGEEAKRQRQFLYQIKLEGARQQMNIDLEKNLMAKRTNPWQLQSRKSG